MRKIEIPPLLTENGKVSFKKKRRWIIVFITAVTLVGVIILLASRT